MAEIAQLVPAYAGVTYARLERSGVSAPVSSFTDGGTPILTTASGFSPSCSSRRIDESLRLMVAATKEGN